MVPLRSLRICLSGNNVKGNPLSTRELSQDKVKRKQRRLYPGLFCGEGKTFPSQNDLSHITSHIHAKLSPLFREELNHI